MPQIRRWMRRSFRIVLATVLVAMGVSLTATPSYAWTTSQSAAVKCVDGQVAVQGTFTNTEPRSPYNDMNVFMSIKNTTLRSGTKTVVSGGGNETFTVGLGVNRTLGGTAVFNLSWTNGRSGTDTRSVSFGALDCRGKQDISAKALCDHDVNNSEWGIVITQVDAKEDAPASVHIEWDNGRSANVALTSYTGKTAHYVTTANLDANITSVTTNIYGTWSGQFNVSHGPACQVKVDVPATPETQDLCNPKGVTDNVTWKDPLPADTTKVKWTESADKRTRTAALIGNTIWTDGTTKPKSWTLPEDSGEVCVTKVPLPAKQLSWDTCNAKGVTDNVTWKSELPASDDQVNWTESADGKTRTATLVDTVYTTWEDGTTAPKDFSLDKDSGEVCPMDARASVSLTGPTCDNPTGAKAEGVNATLNGKLSSEVGSHVAVFKSVDGHLFKDGTDTFRVTYVIESKLTGEQCEVLALTGGFALGAGLLGMGLLALGTFLLVALRRRRTA